MAVKSRPYTFTIKSSTNTKINIIREILFQTLSIGMCSANQISSSNFMHYTVQSYKYVNNLRLIFLFTTANLDKPSASSSMEDDMLQIRKSDLENHNKDGGSWVVIHGKVYDLHLFRQYAPCGSDYLLQYIGKG